MSVMLVDSSSGCSGSQLVTGICCDQSVLGLVISVQRWRQCLQWYTREIAALRGAQELGRDVPQQNYASHHLVIVDSVCMINKAFDHNYQVALSKINYSPVQFVFHHVIVQVMSLIWQTKFPFLESYFDDNILIWWHQLISEMSRFQL